MTIRKTTDAPTFRWVRNHPVLGKTIGWAIIIGIFGGVGYLIWRDLSEGRWLKVLIVGSAGTFFAWRSYAQAKRAVRN